MQEDGICFLTKGFEIKLCGALSESAATSERRSLCGCHERENEKLKKSHTLVLCQAALTVALEIVLNRFCSINTFGTKIGVSFVPIALCAILNGPWVAGACWAVADLLGALLFPIGPYFPGFTVIAFAMGAVYGLFLRKNSGYFVCYVVPTLINCLILGLLVNTLWVTLLYSSRGYWGWFVYRLAQYAILVPVNLILLPFIKKLSVYIKGGTHENNGD